MRRGTACWVNLGTGAPPELSKVRPGIVLSNSIQNERLDSVVIVPLSAQAPEIWPLRLRVELAGMKTDDIDIMVEDNVLTLRGDRKFYEGVPEDSFHRIERATGPFQRRIALPQGADTGTIEASMSDGLLTIEVGKVVQAQPKRVEVKARG